jgi:pimeloyl-ACP methyl ester carboxylesterase
LRGNGDGNIRLVSIKSPRVFFHALMPLVCLLGLFSCRREPPLKAPEPQVSHYERHDKKERVIVFVHGIFGDAKDTWTCANSSAYWPRLLLQDSAFDDSDIYVVAYDTPYFGNRMTIDEVVSNLANRFESDKVFSHREVVFVTHSLGGLIAQRFLVTHREYAKQVPFMFFFSTPETGSQLAQLGRIFSADPLLDQMFGGEKNSYLLNLENEWLAANFTVKRYCAYETKPTHGVLVVDRLSGTRNCTNKTAIPISKDHSEIVKPCSIEDDAYIAVRNAVEANPIAPPPVKTRDEIVTREWRASGLNVDCNRTNAGRLQASVALDPKFDEKVLSVSARFEGADNIKDQSGPTVEGAPGPTVAVSYGFNGLDRNFVGNCPGGGHATVVVIFTVQRKVPIL